MVEITLSNSYITSMQTVLRRLFSCSVSLYYFNETKNYQKKEVKYKPEHRCEHKEVQKLRIEIKRSDNIFSVIASFSEAATARDSFGVAEQMDQILGNCFLHIFCPVCGQVF